MDLGVVLDPAITMVMWCILVTGVAMIPIGDLLLIPFRSRGLSSFVTTQRFYGAPRARTTESNFEDFASYDIVSGDASMVKTGEPLVSLPVPQCGPGGVRRRQW